MFFYDDTCSLVQVSNSILRHFRVPTFHSSFAPLDELLDKGAYKKVVILLFDGLGKAIKQKHLSETDFLRKKTKFEITSVYPPTTVAATTALLSGRYPMETGWLGWCQFFPQHNIIIDMFSGRPSYQKEPLSCKPLSQLYCAYEDIFTMIKQGGRAEALRICPENIEGGEAKNFPHLLEILAREMKKERSHFIYGYWTDPDYTIHEYGVHSVQARRCIKDINKKVAKLAKENPDNLILVLADHGLVDTTFYPIEEHADFYATLKNNTYLDSRSSFFLVKEGQEKKFEQLFDLYYGREFHLFTKQEVVDKALFGKGTPHPTFSLFLGDYLAVSISDKGFKAALKPDDFVMVAAHAGGLEEENRIEIAVLNEKP